MIFPSGWRAIAWAMALQPDGKIIYASGLGPPYAIVRLDAAGVLDSSFNAGSGANATVRSVLVQTDGRIIVAGWFTNFSGAPHKGIVLLQSNGVLDSTFTASTDGNVESAVLQPDDQLLLAGGFGLVNGLWRPRLARLNTYGSLDTAFSPAINTNIWLLGLALQPDGRVVAVGSDSHFDGSYYPYVARFQTNGSFDFALEAAQYGSEPFTWANCVAVQSDGHIVVGGAFTMSSFQFNNLARLNPDGGIDPNFNPGQAADNWVNLLSVQGDDKIYAAGYF